VWELEPQADEGDQDPAKEDGPLLGPGPGGAAAHMAAALLQGGLVGGGPEVGQLGDQLARLLPGDPGQDRMGEGRTSPSGLDTPMHDRVALRMSARSPR